MTDIALENVTKLYGAGPTAVRAVDDVSLAVPSGELFFLLGPSGCGKTTLLRIVAGLVEPTAGCVRIAGRDVTRLPPEHRGTAMVFQNYALWPHMTVAQNVQFGPKMRGVGRAQRRRLAGRSLERVEMAGLERRKPNQLSGGQQQRVAVARALAAETSCLLFDEPLSNLDARLRLHMRGELRKLVKSTGATAIYVTHDQKEALSMADRVAVMNDGRIVQVGEPCRLYSRPATRFVADFLGEANFLAGAVAAAGAVASLHTPLGTVLAAGCADLPVGRNVTCCVRPERVQLLDAGAPAADAPHADLPACVEESIYMGEVRQYVCRVADGGLWKVTAVAGPEAAHPPGTRVRLRIGAGDVTVLTG